MSQTPTRALLIGVGNPDRGDDGAGRAVARLVGAMRLPGVEVAEAGGEVADLIERMGGARTVYFVDASFSGALPGKIKRIDAARERLPVDSPGGSTHGFGLAAAVELARSLGQLPATCIVYAIEGARFDIGEPPTRAVEKACATLAESLRRELLALASDTAVQHA